MKIEYDKDANALYIRFKKGRVVKTVKMKDKLLADIDARGNVLGIELLDASSQMPKGTRGNVEISIPTLG